MEGVGGFLQLVCDLWRKNLTFANKIFACTVFADSLQISQAELQTFLSQMGSVDSLASNGIRVGGEKFM